PELLQAMDVVLLTSRWEGLPIAALEAMAAARPLVASRLPGMSELIEDGLTGVLVSPGDSEQFAAATLTLLRGAARRAAMGARARRRVADHFSLERMVTSTVDAYHAALTACGSTVEVRTT
ncbi:MAG: glycosyltransferase, partial [bacterium]